MLRWRNRFWPVIHNILDRKLHFTHAVQQILLAERGGCCLVIRQIDISISVAFVFYNRRFHSEAHFRYSVQSKQQSPRAISDNLLRVSVCVCVCCSSACLLAVVVSDTFLSCSHSLPHNGFSVMIVVFCSALTHEALRLTMGAHVCCIMMKLLPKVSQKARMDGI